MENGIPNEVRRAGRIPIGHQGKIAICLVLAVVSGIALATESHRFRDYHDWRNLYGVLGFSSVALELWLSMPGRAQALDNAFIRMLRRVLITGSALLFLGFALYYSYRAAVWMQAAVVRHSASVWWYQGHANCFWNG